MPVLQALLAAATFGLSAPLAKRLLDAASPLFLAGLLYLGARVIVASIILATGGIVLGWPSGHLDLPVASLAVAGACLLWAIDNNLTRLIADADAALVAQVKGLAAGA